MKRGLNTIGQGSLDVEHLSLSTKKKKMPDLVSVCSVMHRSGAFC